MRKRFRFFNYWSSLFRTVPMADGRNGHDAKFVLFDIRYYAGYKLNSFSVCICNFDFVWSTYKA